MSVPDPQFTALLKQVSANVPGACEALLPQVYDVLRQMAAAYIQRERPDHTLQPTALVHEAYVKLVDRTHAHYNDKQHFMAVAARAMRQILVDHARSHLALKRGGDRARVTLEEGLIGGPDRQVDLLDLEEALAALEALDSRRSRVVEYRFFGGMTNQEAAAVLGVSPKTTEADWYMARAFLRRALSEKTP